MKKNLAMRVASLVVVCTLITSCLVSSTFAKYTSSASATGTVTVAKWAFKVNNQNITETKDLTFDLFTTINDTNGGADEKDVVEKKIAPGTKGSFEIALENASEVTANYTVTLGEDESSTADIPIVFKVANEDKGTNTTTAQLAAGAKETVTVTWEWPFETEPTDTGDTTDTSLGMAHGTYTAKVTITATQVD